MHLLVVVFLLIGMLGIYAQVAAIEAGRLFSKQHAIADALVIWHNAASSIASNVVRPSTVSATGCSLTNGYTSVGRCSKSTLFTGNPSSYATVTGNSTYSLAGATYPQLPASYNYEWNSILFQPTSPAGYYVITFVPPATITASNPAPGFISTTPGTLLRLTASDLFSQLRQTNLPLYSYGVVRTVSGVRQMSMPPLTYMNGGAVQTMSMTYTVPSVIPDGSIAIISSPSQCTAC